MNYFEKSADENAKALDALGVLKEGGSIKTVPTSLGYTTSKKPEAILRASISLHSQVVRMWDMRGYESFLIHISGSNLTQYRVEVSIDLNKWTPIKLTLVKGYEVDYPILGETFRPAYAGEGHLYKGTTNAPFVRIFRVTGFIDTAYWPVFVISLSSTKEDFTIKPLYSYPLSSKRYNLAGPVGLTNAEATDVFPLPDGNATFGPTLKYLLTSVSFYNSGTVSEVQIKEVTRAGVSTTKYSCIVGANQYFKEVFDPYIEFLPDSKIQVVVVTAGATIYPTIHALKVQA